MSFPTSAKTFAQLQTDVAEALSIAYYGAAGTGVAAPPNDTQDADKVKRIINDAIRMFIADAPPQGWNWLEPTDSLTLWASFAVDDTITATGVHDSGYTTITASEDMFYETMLGHDITITDSGTYTIYSYTSATEVVIEGDHEFVDKTFSMTANGNYTMPLHFGGEYSDRLTYAAESGIATNIEWCNATEIREHRRLSGVSTGYPSLASVRITSTNGRWELMAFPTPSTDLTVELKYPIHFDLLTADGDYHPAGYKFDDAVLAACLARAQMDEGSLLQGRMEYYRQIALPNAYRTDARSRPRKLGKLSTGRSRRYEPAYRHADWRVNYG
jgi:hypothetical protein